MYCRNNKEDLLPYYKRASDSGTGEGILYKNESRRARGCAVLTLRMKNGEDALVAKLEQQSGSNIPKETGSDSPTMVVYERSDNLDATARDLVNS